MTNLPVTGVYSNYNLQWRQILVCAEFQRKWSDPEINKIHGSGADADRSYFDRSGTAF